jgi:hypothetical protein
MPHAELLPITLEICYARDITGRRESFVVNTIQILDPTGFNIWQFNVQFTTAFTI